MPLGAYIRLDAIFSNAGAGGDDSGDIEEFGRSEGGEGVEGLAGGWTEAARLTGSAWGLVTFLSLDEKGGGEGMEGFAGDSTEVMRSTCSAWGLFALLSLDEEGGR